MRVIVQADEGDSIFEFETGITDKGCLFPSQVEKPHAQWALLEALTFITHSHPPGSIEATFTVVDAFDISDKSQPPKHKFSIVKGDPS